MVSYIAEGRIGRNMHRFHAREFHLLELSPDSLARLELLRGIPTCT